MGKRIIFATGNEGKMKEIRMILADLGVPVLSMKEAGVSADIVEDGKTFEENAAIKAETIRDLTGAIVLADDSGLEIDYLGGEPGIYSARYMGEDTSYDIKNQNLLDRLEGVPDEKRTARFVCAICAALPDGRESSPPEEPLKESSAMASAEKTDLDTIRFSGFRSMAAAQQNCHRRRKMN